MKTQVAGAECKVCGRTIVFCADGKSCEACGAVAHLDCEPQAACRACGHVPSAAEKSPISPHRGVVPAEEDWRQTNVTGHARANQSRTDAPPEAPDTDLKPLERFWRCTWSVWRCGVLSEISKRYAQSAGGDLEKFRGFYPQTAMIDDFFASHAPRVEEFLIVFAKSAERATGVMTNQRIWMRQKDSPEWVELNVAEIAGF